MESNFLLNHIERFVHLTEAEKILLTSKFQLRKYLKGQFVLQQGDTCRVESLVVSGCLRMFGVDKIGKEHIIMFASEGSWISDMESFTTQSPASYNIQCIESVSLLQVTYEDLNFLYDKIPKLERFFRIIIQNAFIASERRTINNLKFTARDRYLLFRNQYPMIEQRVPQYMIASYVGITKEFLSKIRKKLIYDT